MKSNELHLFSSNEVKFIDLIENPVELDKIYLGSRICDNCGKTKDTLGGKTCSKGHFICHSCASRHVHCPLCKHTLR